jgi:hypothetical protein
MTDWVLAIDFGTSFSSAAIRSDGRAVLVRMPSPEGPRDVMPSAVFQPEGGELVVGWVAENQAVLAPDRFEPTPKRRLGVDEHLVLGGEPVPVAAAVAGVLGRVFAEARRSRGETAPSLVSLTHPASWAGGRVDALVEAARVAGIERPRVLSEPEAAALHFATERVGIGGLVAVYDLGGGTFDAAVLERVGEASFRLAGRPGGRDGLGGEEFDRKLYEHVAKQLAFEEPEQWARIRANPRSHRDFRIEVRRAKEALSYSAAHDLYLPEATGRTSWRVTREEFENLIRADLDASVEILARTLAEAGIDDRADPSKLVDVYLAGGSSRIPLVAQAIGERLGRVPRSLDEPKTVVALGASNVERSGPAPSPPVVAAAPTHAPERSQQVVEEDLAVAPVAALPELRAREAERPDAAAPPQTVGRPARLRLLQRFDLLALAGVAVTLVGLGMIDSRSSQTRLVWRLDGYGALWQMLAPVGVPIAVVAVVVALRSARGHRMFSAGLLLGFGIATLLRFLSVFDRNGPHVGEGAERALVALPLLGAALVAAAGVVAYRRLGADQEEFTRLPRPRALLGLAAPAGIGLLVAGLFVPSVLWWHTYDTFSFFKYDRGLSGWLVLEPIGIAVAALASALVLFAIPRLRGLACGLLVAFGTQALLSFLPQVAYPLADGRSDPGFPPGALLTPAGGLLILGTGVLAYRLRARAAHDAPPDPTRG